jgi:hypothetical protein
MANDTNSSNDTGSAFQIPGNIKQQYLPFVLNPFSSTNLNVGSSPDLKKIKRTLLQRFSFRDSSKLNSHNFGKLGIVPNSYEDYMKNDIANKLLYNSKHYSEPITANDIMNAIPAIQIREYLPDTRLDQCINLISDILSEAKQIFTKKSDSGGGDADLSKLGWFDKFKIVMKSAFDYIVGNSDKNLFTELAGTLPNGGDNMLMKGSDNIDTFVANFPFTLYYRLQSCVSTNMYELPCITSDKMLYNSEGDKGWAGTGAVDVTGQISKLPWIGSIVKSILGNVRINFMPWWDSEEGSQTYPNEINIKFDLFNDTADKAMMNFIFVNTIVPNNKWIQYGMFQHSSSLYDIKIEGYNRLFACCGKFSVSYSGVLRDPPTSWLDNLVNKHTNNSSLMKPGHAKFNKNSLNDVILNDKLIKIPDVYNVSMTFKSLLPDNFNTYLYTYICNNNQMKDSSSIYQNSSANNIVNAISGCIDYVKKELNKQGLNAADPPAGPKDNNKPSQ